ncbi:MAG: response regulator transcription factor [Nitrosomonadales bacterium]|nr:response regulator transcription factor [Nitrosomonadales bacterium]
MMKVFIVEDSEMVREHLQSMLSDIPGVDLVGYAVDELGAIERIDALRPDAVTLDLRLKPGSGIAVLDHIKKNHAWIKVIVLTNYVDEFYADSCKNAGADCFFDKTFQFSRVRSALWSWVYADGANNKVAAPQRP